MIHESHGFWNDITLWEWNRIHIDNSSFFQLLNVYIVYKCSHIFIYSFIYDTDQQALLLSASWVLGRTRSTIKHFKTVIKYSVLKLRFSKMVYNRALIDNSTFVAEKATLYR